MARNVLIAYGLFGALAFGWRMWLHYRRTGSTGFKGFSGRVGSVEWIGGALFAAAIVAAPLSTVLDLTGRIERWPRLDGCGWIGAGVLLYLCGLAGTLWSQLSMGESWRIGVDAEERTDLIMRGPFLQIRNPIYSFMVVAILGLVLIVPNLLAWATIAILVVALELHVRCVEEPYLLRVHGKIYRRYASAVGRFVPGIGRTR